MPLVPQQAILYGEGNTLDNAIADLDKQMDELPDVKIVSINFASHGGDRTLLTVGGINYKVLAVVETV